MSEKEFTAKVSKMGRHKMISVPKQHPIIPGDQVKVKKIKEEK
jgi:hypothetical protein